MQVKEADSSVRQWIHSILEGNYEKYLYIYHLKAMVVLLTHLIFESNSRHIWA